MRSMWLIAGTVPEPDFPLYWAGGDEPLQIKRDMLWLPGNRSLPIARGTPALVATALLAAEAIGIEPPRVLLAGDIGKGNGSRAAYAWLAENMASLAAKGHLAGITFHYFYPDLEGHNQVYMALEELRPRPILVADAGFMYVAKMSGFAAEYDLFTPDIGEMAFMADEKAPHPFYTRGFLLATGNEAGQLVERAWQHGNCAANVIVKGKTDYIWCEGQLVGEVSEPAVPAMECIGGTGDIVTGLATAYLAAGHPVCKSALWAARATRYLAEFCKPDPATQVATLIGNIGPMLEFYKTRIEE